MLDKNLYTLNCVASASKPEEVYMIEEGTGNQVYMRTRSDTEDGAHVDIYEPLSLAPLASMQTHSFKHRSITLHNPPYQVDLNATGRIHWEFTFKWEGEWKLFWRRDVGMSGKNKGYTAYISRKPDPDVACALYRASETGGYIQFLDYNLQRFAIADRRGLELVLLAGLFSFLEQSTDDSATPSPLPSTSASPNPSASASPRPPAAYAQTEPNEVVVDSRPMVDAIVRAMHLLDDPLMLYVFFRAREDAEAVKKAVKAAGEVKRRRSKEKGEELMQYVIDDDSDANRSTPPKSIRIFLSRTPLDELLPSASSGAKPPARTPSRPGPAVPAKYPNPANVSATGTGGGGGSGFALDGWKRKLFSPVVSRDREV